MKLKNIALLMSIVSLLLSILALVVRVILTAI